MLADLSTPNSKSDEWGCGFFINGSGIGGFGISGLITLFYDNSEKALTSLEDEA